MKPIHLLFSLPALWLLGFSSTQANPSDTITHHDYEVSAEVAIAGDKTPLWMTANRHGISGVSGDYGYLRAKVEGEGILGRKDKRHPWTYGYGVDLVGGYGMTGSKFFPAQAYLQANYRAIRFQIGMKENQLAMKDDRLSSGSQTFGINARPVPQVRFEIPEYLSITGKSNWAAIKGHISYGMMTDGNWQEKYTRNSLYHYSKNGLYHSKAGYLRIGNENKFPLTVEGGLEMATQFGGTSYRVHDREDLRDQPVKMPHNFRAFFDALFCLGGDPTDGVYTNVAGNTLGSWLLALNYKGKNWRARVYYDHFFEDHSMMFLEYGWKDGLIGAELELPRNPVVSKVVYEHLYTKYQAGPIYHDHNDVIPDQVSGVDNYYNHHLYAGWEHWGQGFGNPLIVTPLYRADGTLNFNSNRVKAHHIGLMGSPTAEWDYRVLASFMQSWGTYAHPFDEIRRNASLLCEVSYRPQFSRTGHFAKGWQFTAAWAMDRGSLIGDNNAFSLKVTKSGLFCK